MKKIISIILSVVMLISIATMISGSASAETMKASISLISNVENANPGDEITLYLRVDNNQGFAGLQSYVEYDENNLELKSIVSGELGDKFATKGLDVDTGNVNFFADDKNVTGDGILATLTFSVIATEIEKYEITQIVLGFGDIDENPLEYDLNGTVTLNATVPEICKHENLTSIAQKTASCIESGNNAYYYCADCGKYFKDAEATIETSVDAEKLPLTDHNFVENATDDYLKSKATCTKLAVYYKSCSVCKEKSDETFTYGELASHDYSDEWKYDTNGHWHECVNCGDKHDEAAHISSGAATKEEAEVCTVCGYVIAPPLVHIHNLKLVEGKDSTCTEEGQKSYYECEDEKCGKWFEDGTASIEITDKNTIVIPKKSHTPSDWIVDKAATNTEKGSQHKECVDCHTVLETAEIPPQPDTQPDSEPQKPTEQEPSKGSATSSEASNKSSSSTSGNSTSGSSSSGAIQTGQASIAILVLIVLLLGVAIVYFVNAKRNRE